MRAKAMKHAKIDYARKGRNRRALGVLVSVALIAVVGVGITLAYKTDLTDTLDNSFEVPEIETVIEETFDRVTKDNITVTSSEDSDVDVYVRLKFVIQTLEPVYDESGNLVFTNSDGDYVYTIYDDDGTLLGFTIEEGSSVVDDSITQDSLTYAGNIIATPDSFDEDGLLVNLPISIVNAFNIEGLNVDFTGSGDADWFTDANEETGIYFYKYSLAPGESAYDLAIEVTQEIFYEDCIVRLTVLVDSVQVDGVEGAWINVDQSDYLDANGNPILYSSTYTEENGGTGIPPTEDYDDYEQRFSSNYVDTQGINSFGEYLTILMPDYDTTDSES